MASNTTDKDGVVRWDGGAAGGYGLSQNQMDYQDSGRPFMGYGGTRSPRVGADSANGSSFADVMAAISASGSGSGSGSASSNAYKLGMAELGYKKQKDMLDYETDQAKIAEDKAAAARSLGYLKDYYAAGQAGTGGYSQEFDKLLGMINTQGGVSEKQIGSSYDDIMKSISSGYGAAESLGDSGYSALNSYLSQNPNNPYAGMRATVGSSPDGLVNYLRAYGVSDAPVQGQIQADELQAQQGAGNYQNLIDILSGVARSGQQSRLAESAMSQNLFNTSLGQERAGYEGRAASQRQLAMNQLQQEMFQQRLQQESARAALATQLAQSIISAGGSPTGSGTSGVVVPPKDETVVPPAVLPPAVIQQLINLTPAATAQGTTAQDLLDQLNYRRGR